MATADHLTPEDLAAEVDHLLPQNPLVVALGGGADSALAAWVATHRRAARCVFVRHGLDGSAELEASAASLGAHLGLGFTVVDAPVDAGPNLEERARKARWDAIARVVDADEVVVTGHTQDDQAETVMMNMMRGSGSAGVAGMLRSRPGVVRPLLGFSRAAVRSLAEELGLPFADDPANDDDRHLRNRIRRSLLPDLEQTYAPGVRVALARLGALAAADDLLIEQLADDIPMVDGAKSVSIPVAALVTAPQPIATRSVRRALRRLLAPYAGSQADVEAVLDVAAGRADSVMISGAITVVREGPFVTVDAEVAGDVSPMPVTIRVPSTIRFGVHTMTFEEVDASQITPVSTLVLDPNVFGPATLVRGVEAGDRIDIDGGSKTARTVLSERDVPVRSRSTWPVVVEGGRIAAIAGIRAAPWTRPTTREAVAIRWKQESP